MEINCYECPLTHACSVRARKEVGRVWDGIIESWELNDCPLYRLLQIMEAIKYL